jgi:hypothetical protein
MFNMVLMCRHTMITGGSTLSILFLFVFLWYISSLTALTLLISQSFFGRLTQGKRLFESVRLPFCGIKRIAASGANRNVSNSAQYAPPPGVV